MRKMKILFLLVILIGCNSKKDIFPNKKNVESTLICSSSSVMGYALDSAIVDLYNSYKYNGVAKSNYEAFCQSFSFEVNWNPRQKLLFAGFGSDLCGSWNVVFINVDEAKIKSFIALRQPIISGKGPYLNLSKFFDEEKDKNKAKELLKKYFLTNSCNGKG